MIRARDVEQIVWQKCRSLIENPEEAIALRSQRLHTRPAQTMRIEGERQSLQKALAGKESERERVMTLYRRGLIGFDDVEGQLEAISKEAAQLQALLAAHQAQADLTAAVTENYHTTVELLQNYKTALKDIDDKDDLVQKQAIIERLIPRIIVEKQGKGRQKVAAFRAYFRADPGGVFHVDSAADFGYSAHHR
jgi:site-specific DNA recombinase